MARTVALPRLKTPGQHPVVHGLTRVAPVGAYVVSVLTLKWTIRKAVAPAKRRGQVKTIARPLPLLTQIPVL